VSARPHVLVCANTEVRETVIVGEGRERLDRLASWEWLPSEGSCADPELWGGPSSDPADADRLWRRLGDVDILLICHGAPYIDGAMLDAAPRLRFVGELIGDRFANRIDVVAAHARAIRVVDTSHGSSPPVAEWALGLVLVGLRSAGAHCRRLLAGDAVRLTAADPGFRFGELSGATVGLIGLGHIGRRLVELLRPFACRILVYDPYADRELAAAGGVQPTTLAHVLSDARVVVCAAPLTPATRGMLGARELNLLAEGAVFVNVGRGAIVDSDALVARARRGDIRVCLDVFEPEPVPADSLLRQLPNVFLSPHIAGVTAACRPRCLSFMVDEIERFLAGHETLLDLVPRTPTR
jgi:D-3-phosphoglycerate dehydrogenase / 2-oxoglutarate reductase